MTFRNFILAQLEANRDGLSCTQLAEIAIKQNLTKNYRSKANITASFSSILFRLRKEKKVKLSRKKAVRGGKIYVIHKVITVTKINFIIP
jgi:hypothetical protein